MPHQILVVDDDDALRAVIHEGLTRAGYLVQTAMNGTAALRLFEQEHPALVILDVMLGDEPDGWEVCRILRARSNVSILMLTSLADDAHQITGLDLGADDYLTKPFRLQHLLARVRAVLRRAGYSGAPLRAGPLALDPVQREVLVDDNPLSLTRLEFALLETLMRHPGRAFTRAELIDHCWEPGFDGVDRVVDVHLAAVRRKLGHWGKLIKAVRGIGYQFSPDSSRG